VRARFTSIDVLPSSTKIYEVEKPILAKMKLLLRIVAPFIFQIEFRGLGRHEGGLSVARVKKRGWPDVSGEFCFPGAPVTDFGLRNLRSYSWQKLPAANEFVASRF